MMRLVVIGRHLFVRTGALLGTLTLATSVAARVGPSTLAGHQIALQVETFLALSLDALAIAAQAMVGTLLGAGEQEEARETGRRLLRFGILAGVILAVIVVATAPLLPHIFTGDAAVVHRATAALVVVGVLQIPGSIAYVIDGVLMGASDFRFLQWAVIAASLAFVPVAGAVLHWHRLGVVGVWCGLLVWMGARAVLNGVRFSGERWPQLAG
jgi:putative MATE family efflux protein